MRSISAKPVVSSTSPSSFLDQRRAPLRIPVSASSRDGFAEWTYSAEFPNDLNASRIGRAIFIEPKFRQEPALCIPNRATTSKGFSDWFVSPKFPEYIRALLISDHLIIEPRMEDINTHNKIKTIISAALVQLVEDNNLGHFTNDGMLLKNEEARINTTPDAVFASYSAIESGAVRVGSIGKGKALVQWLGSPDWVLEIVSPFSEIKDERDLLKGYFRAGISEYWLVDARGEEVDFRIYTRGARRYESVPEENGWIVSPLFKRRFRLTREVDRVKLLRYRLHVAELNKASA